MIHEDKQATLFVFGLILLVILSIYLSNIGTYEVTGYVVMAEYDSFPFPTTRITIAYGHPNTLSEAYTFSFKVYGYHEFEYNKLYRIRTHAEFFQIYKHMVTKEMIEQ